MIVDLRVHVEIVHYKGRQGYIMRPRESFSELAKVLLAEKINVGLARDLPKSSLIHT